MPRTLSLPIALVVLALAACVESGTGPSSDDSRLSADEAQTLAAEFGAQDAATLGDFGTPSFSLTADGTAPAAAATTATTSFTRTRTCPLGGSVTVQGTRTHTFDREARSASHAFNATRTENACAFAARRGEGATLTITGTPNTVLTASHAVTNGVPGVGTATKKGSFAWTRSTGQSGTCTVDLTQTWDPASRTYTLKGTFCNQSVDLTRTWDEITRTER